MAPKQLILGLVQQCPILIFISRINLWSYFPFLPLPFLSYLLYSKNLIISPRSSAPLTFTPNVCELCCILRCCSCCQPWYPTRLRGNLVISFSFQQPGLGEPLHPPNPHLASLKSTPGCHSTVKEDGILSSSFALMEPGLLQQIKAKGSEKNTQGRGMAKSYKVWWFKSSRLLTWGFPGINFLHKFAGLFFINKG